MSEPFDWNGMLTAILTEFGCQTGTIHRTVATDARTLELVCQAGVPEALLPKINSIPFGKGIAGAAAERAEPVELCNLQADLGGVAKPDARQTGVAGSVAVPVFSAAENRVVGTLGIGKFTPHEFSDVEKSRLADIAADIAVQFHRNPLSGG